MKIKQKYVKFINKQVTITSLEKGTKIPPISLSFPTSNINSAKQSQALMPNHIHSLDASCMITLV